MPNPLAAKIRFEGDIDCLEFVTPFANPLVYKLPSKLGDMFVCVDEPKPVVSGLWNSDVSSRVKICDMLQSPRGKAIILHRFFLIAASCLDSKS